MTVPWRDNYSYLNCPHLGVVGILPRPPVHFPRQGPAASSVKSFRVTNPLEHFLPGHSSGRLTWR